MSTHRGQGPHKEKEKEMQELEQSQGLESPEDTKRRLRSVYVCHLSMLLSGFGNSVIYIGMFPYISSVGSNDLNETPHLSPGSWTPR